MFHPITLIVATLACLVANASAYGQQKNSGKAITVQETFEPTFRIEPLSNRISGRGGDVIPFSFTIESANRDTTIEVSPIGLRQELTGLILHDTNASQAEFIRLLSPEKMVLTANKSTSIEGVVRIPAGDAKHYSIGMLVKDVGGKSNFDPVFKADGSRATQAGIRFITQYVLRLDLDIEGVRGEQGNRLTIEDAKMTPFDGRPRLQSEIVNPTDTTFEFELRAKISSSPSDRSIKPLRLSMPVRNSVTDETRYVGRILPKSRVRMEELLPDAIAGGEYDVELELLSDARVVRKKACKVQVDPEDYPAQEVLIAEAAPGLQVSPAQIELSQLRGGNRRLTMLFKNNSKEDRSVKVAAKRSDDLDLAAATFQPSEFRLAPGASRKIALTMQGAAAPDRNLDFGYVLIESKSEKKDFHHSKRLPLALLYKKPADLKISMSPVVWDPSGKYPCFRTTVENAGDSHMPIDARLTIFNENGQKMQIPGGFGKWLMPNGKMQLTFRVDSMLQPGDYKLRCELQTGANPVVMDQNFTVSDLDTAIEGKPVAKSR